MTIADADPHLGLSWGPVATVAPTTTAAPVTTTTREPAPKVAKPKPVAPKVAPSGGGVSAFLRCVARYESGSSYTSHTPSGSGGMYGVLVSTWANAYGIHYPWQASPAQQDAFAQALYERLGTRPWSTRHLCGG